MDSTSRPHSTEEHSTTSSDMDVNEPPSPTESTATTGSLLLLEEPRTTSSFMDVNEPPSPTESTVTTGSLPSLEDSYFECVCSGGCEQCLHTTNMCFIGTPNLQLGN